MTQSQAPGRMQKAGECQQQNSVKAITRSKDLRHPIRGVGRLPHRGKAVSLIIARPGQGGLCLLRPGVWLSLGRRMGPNPGAISSEIMALGGLCEKVRDPSRWPQGSTGSTLLTCLRAPALCSQAGECPQGSLCPRSPSVDAMAPTAFQPRGSVCRDQFIREIVTLEHWMRENSMEVFQP